MEDALAFFSSQSRLSIVGWDCICVSFGQGAAVGIHKQTRIILGQKVTL